MIKKIEKIFEIFVVISMKALTLGRIVFVTDGNYKYLVDAENYKYLTEAKVI